MGCAVGAGVGDGATVAVGTGVGEGCGVEVGGGGGDVGAEIGVGEAAETSVTAVGVAAGNASGSESPHEVRATTNSIETATIVSGDFASQRKLGRQRRYDITTPIMVDSLWAG